MDKFIEQNKTDFSYIFSGNDIQLFEYYNIDMVDIMFKNDN